ncbi:SDR family NAD(P)-dependent oxidoreductase [Rhizobium mayense]|uniref:SDR family oxidoreductase n=1 Tax=Rhizobium mayense TaxID=1312184 RepID=A0ABT7K3D1_9HYPH|nr:SDR family oxidoreductase [Rhizobium mayense]MDL2403120.1 SDR family oxidoreductase [Rhizobium mayense]
MQGLNVVVIGGANGFGLETVKLMIRDQASKIVIIDISEERLEAAKGELSGKGTEIITVAGDIARADTAHRAFAKAVDAVGRVHSVVNCAAIYPRAPLLEISDEMWDAENAINIKGTYHIMVAAVKHMQEQKAEGQISGRIVNITSVDAFKAHPQNAHYAATKAAVVSLTRSFAHAFAKDQILVNSVAPAGMATEKAKSLGFLGELAAANPLGRAAEPAEIAEFVVIVAGPKNTYMTGEQVIVSGGYVYA